MIVGGHEQVADRADPIAVEGESRSATKNSMKSLSDSGRVMRFVTWSPGRSPTQMCVPPFTVFGSNQGSEGIGGRREFGEGGLDQVGVGVDEPAVEKEFGPHMGDGS